MSNQTRRSQNSLTTAEKSEEEIKSFTFESVGGKTQKTQITLYDTNFKKKTS